MMFPLCYRKRYIIVLKMKSPHFKAGIRLNLTKMSAFIFKHIIFSMLILILKNKK